MDTDDVMRIAWRAARAVYRVPGTVLGVSLEDVVQAAAMRGYQVAHRGPKIVYRAARFGALDEVRKLSGRGDGRAGRFAFPTHDEGALDTEVPDFADEVVERVDFVRYLSTLGDATGSAVGLLIGAADMTRSAAASVIGVTPSGVTYALRRLRALLEAAARD